MDLKNKRRVRVLFLSIILVALFLFLLSGSASAAWWNPISWVVGLVEFIAGVIKAIINLVKMILEIAASGLMAFIAGIVKKILEGFFDLMKYLLTLNPTVYCGPTASGCQQNEIVKNVTPTIMSIIQPFYVMMTIFTGMYYIFAAMDPKRRSAAKNMLLKLLVGMVIVGLALPIYQFVLDLSAALTRAIFAQAYNEFAGHSSTSIAVFAVIMVISIIVYPQLLVVAIFVVLYILLVVLIVMALRYVAVVLFAILFPMALFLYFFDSTKNLGATLAYQALTWIFVPTVQAMMIVITFFALESMITGATITDPTSVQGAISGLSPTIIVVSFFMVLGGLIGILISPLVMMQIMKWVGGAVAGYGMLKIPQAQTKEELWKAAGLTALGGTMMGGMSRGLPFAATEAAYMAQYYNPAFSDAVNWRDVVPTMGDVKGWFGGGSAAAGGAGGAAAPWAGASARARRARMARGEEGVGPDGVMRERRGLIRDFFGTYADALTYDRRKTAQMMSKYGPEASEGGGKPSGKKGTERGVPLSPATTLAGSERDQMGQYTTISDDSYGARGVYLREAEGPPFLSIPLYFLGGIWGRNLNQHAGPAFKRGDIAKGVSISLFETFKIFSPFRPIRHLGRILYTAIPEFVPPIPFPVPFIGWTLRDVAWWGSRKMAGVGFGQMASRAGWAARLAVYESEYESAKKRWNKSGKTDATAKDEMDEAAKKYAKLLDEMREGSGIRRMSDLDYYNKKLNQLFGHNRDMHFDVMRNLRTGIGSRDGMLEAVERVRRAGGNRSAAEKVVDECWKKRIDAETDAEERAKLQARRDSELLLFDYIQQHHGGGTRVDDAAIADFMADRQDKGLSDFMKYNAAMRFGVGVRWGYNAEAGEMGEKGAWSRTSYNLDEMGRYIGQHEDAAGKDSLVVVEKDGEFRMSRHRILEGAAYGCATQNEVLTTPDGRALTNIYIIDARRSDGRVYSFVNVDGSEYVERMRGHYETGGGLGGFWGEENERTQQWLDAHGVGFAEGFTYRQVGEGNFVVHYRGKPVTELTAEEEAEVRRITRRDASELTRDHVLLDETEYTAQRQMAIEMDRQQRTKYVHRRYGDRYFNHGMWNALKTAGYKSRDIEQFGLDPSAPVYQRMVADLHGAGYTDDDIGRFGLRGYMQDLKKANQAIYFSGQMVSDLRDRGYTDREIDHMKLTLYQRYVEREYVMRDGTRRGGTSDIRIVNNANNPEVSWVNTDEAGRRTLTINIGSETYEGGHDYDPRNPKSKSPFMQHLEEGDLLGHEITHDRIRGQYGVASYGEIWDDFAKNPAGSRMNDVFEQSSLDQARADIAGALGVTDIGDEKQVKKALRRHGLTKEDLGQMLCEGLADAGGSAHAAVDPAGRKTAYNQSMGMFITGTTDRIYQQVDSEEKARVRDGSWASDTTQDDVLLLARMKSLSTQAGYFDDPAIASDMEREVDQTEAKVGGYATGVGQKPELGYERRTQDYDTFVGIYRAIHSHAVLRP